MYHRCRICNKLMLYYRISHSNKSSVTLCQQPLRNCQHQRTNPQIIIFSSWYSLEFKTSILQNIYCESNRLQIYVQGMPIHIQRCFLRNNCQWIFNSIILIHASGREFDTTCSRQNFFLFNPLKIKDKDCFLPEVLTTFTMISFLFLSHTALANNPFCPSAPVTGFFIHSQRKNVRSLMRCEKLLHIIAHCTHWIQVIKPYHVRRHCQPSTWAN